MLRSGRLMLIRRFREYMERVALSDYFECQHDTLSSSSCVYEHVKLL